jgi:methylase of polypeptide subunit release factors
LLSALSEFPKATGVGVDISSGALAIAKQNAQANGLEGRAEFLLRDLATLPRLREDDALYQRFNVILCNPPYIPSRELDLVGPDVLEYEPHLALFSDGGPTAERDGVDPEGLRMYRLLQKSVASLFTSASESAPSNGSSTGASNSARNCLLVEIGSEDQARAVEGLFSRTSITESLPAEGDNSSTLRFERFLFDASGKYRGLLFLAS